MRILSHRDPETGSRSFAVVVGDRAITAPELRDAGGFDHTDALLDTYWLLESERWQERLADALARALEAGAEGRPVESFAPAAAIQTPEKIVCVGRNYPEHVAEGGRQTPPRPMLFAKFTSAVVEDGGAIVRPAGCHALDFEAELGVVIGRRARRVPAAEAFDHVAGYVVVNDVSARDWQGVKAALHEGEVGDGQWLRAKGSDTFLPMSAILVTRDEVPVPDQLPIRGWLTRGSGPEAGRPFLMQDGNTRDMIWKIPQLIEFITATITLEPGDIVATGTPGGVGVYRDPPIFLEPGDRVRVEVGGIGGTDNPVVAEEAAAAGR
ncbi:MAG: fumarylacetoacetate hydrolase family protein [Chloroflexi bacterium]|nr:fumarylacetoacetate hydrolase family protein [Chloroflexota bacterium]